MAGMDAYSSATATKGPTYCDGPDAWMPGCGWCATCGGALIGKSSWFDSARCAKAWRQNHQLGYAKEAAVRRAGGVCCREGCLQTRQLEVNHIVALADLRRSGFRKGPRDTGCQHHQDNLEVVCVTHHQEATRAQNAARREQATA